MAPAGFVAPQHVLRRKSARTPVEPGETLQEGEGLGNSQRFSGRGVGSSQRLHSRKLSTLTGDPWEGRARGGCSRRSFAAGGGRCAGVLGWLTAVCRIVPCDERDRAFWRAGASLGLFPINT
jgi:hypothetical protein